MKKGTLVIHKMSGCLLEVTNGGGYCVTCLVILVAKGMGSIGWVKGTSVVCVESELREVESVQ